MHKAGLDHFDHVVVLMLENRSFDNLLGYLYQQEGVPEINGVRVVDLRVVDLQN